MHRTDTDMQRLWTDRRLKRKMKFVPLIMSPIVPPMSPVMSPVMSPI